MRQEKGNLLCFDQMALWVVIILYALIHFPFIGIGFGEPDAWRNGLSALDIRDGLGYSPNRVPGFPVVELSFGFLANWVSPDTLWIYTNLLTLMVSLLGMYFFYKIVEYHKIPHPFIPILLLYFIPIIFTNAAFSMDNMWAMTFLLMAYWYLLKVKPFWGSLFFALAIGSRLTSALFLFPFFFYMVWNPRIFPKKKSLRGTVWIVMAVLAWAVIYLWLNIKDLGYLKENAVIPRDYFRSGYYFIQEVFGLSGTLFLIGMIIGRWKKFPSRTWEFIPS